MKKGNITSLLKDWDRNLNPSFEDTSVLKKQILDGINKPHSIPLDRSQYFYIRKKSFYFAIAAAFFLIASAVIFRILTMPLSPANGFDLKTALISKEDLDETKKISAEVGRLFNNKVQWIVRTGDKMEIKPSENPETYIAQSKILVRETVMRKNRDGWQKVFVADIITNPGEQVVFGDGNAKGYLWTHQAGSGVFAMEGRMNLKINGENISLNYSGGQEEYSSMVLKNIKNSDTEYIVYQTVNRI